MSTKDIEKAVGQILGEQGGEEEDWDDKDGEGAAWIDEKKGVDILVDVDSFHGDSFESVDRLFLGSDNKWYIGEPGDADPVDAGDVPFILEKTIRNANLLAQNAENFLRSLNL